MRQIIWSVYVVVSLWIAYMTTVEAVQLRTAVGQKAVGEMMAVEEEMLKKLYESGPYVSSQSTGAEISSAFEHIFKNEKVKQICSIRVKTPKKLKPEEVTEALEHHIEAASLLIGEALKSSEFKWPTQKYKRGVEARWSDYKSIKVPLKSGDYARATRLLLTALQKSGFRNYFDKTDLLEIDLESIDAGDLNRIFHSQAVHALPHEAYSATVLMFEGKLVNLLYFLYKNESITNSILERKFKITWTHRRNKRKQ
eukprot:Filipodium_phascolosomae@DN2076_c0_g1_i11.p1